jgi:hypothetical protein
MNYPSRKARSRKELFQTKKTQLLILTNFWLLYFILIGFIPLTNNTFSFFSDTETINNSFSAADNFCTDVSYATAHIKECVHKDNSGIGNGPETGDTGDGKTDPDNPKHGNDDDHPKPPKSSESKDDNASGDQDDSTAKSQDNNDKSIGSVNLDTVIQTPNNETDNQNTGNDVDKEKTDQ